MKRYVLLMSMVAFAILLLSCSKVPEIMEYDDIDEKPELISQPVIGYPETARNEGIQGKVLTRVLIDLDGTVVEVKIAESSGYELLDNAALEAAKTAVFKPAKHRGKYVKVWVSMPIEFKLSDKS
jgi:protein TonB